MLNTPFYFHAFIALSALRTREIISVLVGVRANLIEKYRDSLFFTKYFVVNATSPTSVRTLRESLETLLCQLPGVLLLLSL